MREGRDAVHGIVEGLLLIRAPIFEYLDTNSVAKTTSKCKQRNISHKVTNLGYIFTNLEGHKQMFQQEFIIISKKLSLL